MKYDEPVWLAYLNKKEKCQVIQLLYCKSATFLSYAPKRDIYSKENSLQMIDFLNLHSANFLRQKFNSCLNICVVIGSLHYVNLFV